MHIADELSTIAFHLDRISASIQGNDHTGIPLCTRVEQARDLIEQVMLDLDASADTPLSHAQGMGMPIPYIRTDEGWYVHYTFRHEEIDYFMPHTKGGNVWELMRDMDETYVTEAEGAAEVYAWLVAHHITVPAELAEAVLLSK